MMAMPRRAAAHRIGRGPGGRGRDPAGRVRGQRHAHHAPPHRLLGVTTLTNFRVVLTATQASHTSGPSATVTAAGYRHTAHGWQLISVQRIGRPGAWSWFATGVCSLRTAQFRPQPSTATPADSITVRLLWGPAIGCLGPYTRTWKP